ncbi:MAG: binding domain protein [Gammaproteobacteria bacterium]|jgi:flavin-dependent dehydrogenase|nr:binding domain protein [Gammaproteobacteria bacterium]
MNYDIAIIGAGLTGSATAALLAKQGFKVILLDKGTGLNFHLSETLLVQDLTLLDSLGITNQIANTYHYEMVCYYLDKDARQKVRISHTFDKSYTDGTYLVRVDREKFDKTLLDCAIKNGVVYRPCCEIKNIDFTENATEIFYNHASNNCKISAKFIVDASGKSSLLANKLNLKSQIKKLDDRVTIFSHFESEAIRSGLESHAIYITEIKNGYIFIAPLPGNRFSVGLVLSEQAQGNFTSSEEIFFSLIKETPWINRSVLDSHQVLPVITANNHSYLCKNLLTNKYALVGEAAAFRDPFLCNGISANLKIVEKTVEAIVAIFSNISAHPAYTETYENDVNIILENQTKKLLSWIDSYSLKLSVQGLADPHIPYGIPYFLLSAFKSSNESCVSSINLMNAARKTFSEQIS